MTDWEEFIGKDSIARAKELRAQGLTWKEVQDQLEKEGEPK